MQKIYYYINSSHDSWVLEEKHTKPYKNSSALETLKLFDRYIQNFRNDETPDQLNEIKNKARLVKEGYCYKRSLVIKICEAIKIYFGFACQSQAIEKIFDQIQKYTLLDSTFLKKIPLDLQASIIDFLSLKDIQSLSLVSKSFKVFAERGLFNFAKQCAYKGENDLEKIKEYLNDFVLFSRKSIYKNYNTAYSSVSYNNQLAYQDLITFFKERKINEIREMIKEWSNSYMIGTDLDLLRILSIILSNKEVNSENAEKFLIPQLIKIASNKESNLDDIRIFKFILSHLSVSILDKHKVINDLVRNVNPQLFEALIMPMIKKGVDLHQVMDVYHGYTIKNASILDSMVLRNLPITDELLVLLDVKNETGSPACYAVYKNNIELFRKLAEHHLDLSKKGYIDRRGYLTPLEVATELSYRPFIDLLIEKTDTTHTLLLHYAVKTDDAALFDSQIEKGASRTVLDKEGFTCLDVAIKKKKRLFINKLLTVENVKHGHPVTCAIQSQDLPLIRQLVDLGADVHDKDEQGFTCLDHAIMTMKSENGANQDHEIINYFLDERQVDLKQGFPLPIVIEKNDIPFFQKLVEKGADIQSRMLHFGGPPITTLLDIAYMEFIKSQESEVEENAFDLSALEGIYTPQMIDVVLNLDLDLQYSGFALYLAITAEDSDFISTLLSKGLDPRTVKIRDKSQNDVLLLSVLDKEPELYQWYKDKGYIE